MHRSSPRDNNLLFLQPRPFGRGCFFAFKLRILAAQPLLSPQKSVRQTVPFTPQPGSRKRSRFLQNAQKPTEAGSFGGLFRCLQALKKGPLQNRRCKDIHKKKTLSQIVAAESVFSLDSDPDSLRKLLSDLCIAAESFIAVGN